MRTHQGSRSFGNPTVTMTDDTIRQPGRLDNGRAWTSTARNAHRGTVTEKVSARPAGVIARGKK
jgi:hypothetical protein